MKPAVYLANKNEGEERGGKEEEGEEGEEEEEEEEEEGVLLFVSGLAPEGGIEPGRLQELNQEDILSYWQGCDATCPLHGLQGGPPS